MWIGNSSAAKENDVKTTMTLTALILAGALVWAFPQDAERLVGRNPGQILTEYGVPAAVQSERSHLLFEYRDRFGRTWSAIFHDDVLMRVVGEPKAPQDKNRVPISGPYLGQSAIEIVQRMGMAASHEVKGDDLHLRFPRGPLVVLREGRVIAIGE